MAFGEALRPEFVDYSAQIIKNARALAAALQKRGWRVISGGTDNHIVLLDVFGSKQVTGKEAEKALEKVNISVNKNMIPYDTRKPLDPSGIRLGTPAMTTRGLLETDMETVAQFFDETLAHKDDEVKLSQLKKQVTDFALKFPVPGIDF